MSFASMSPAQQAIVKDRLQKRAHAARAGASCAVEDLAKIEQEIKRRKWAKDPVVWAEERLGDKIWEGQRRIMRSVAEHRRTAVMTCHEIGKSFISGGIAAWWIDSHKPGEAFVVTTAPTGPQVKVILWKEIGRAHTRGNLIGRVNQTSWMVEINGKEEVVALGRKPSEYSPTSFQGIHAPYVLVIVDEANGVHGLWEAFDSVIANDDSKILAIGNPDVPVGDFYAACQPKSGWNVIQINAFESPNFNGNVDALPPSVLKQLIGHTYVEEKRSKWARSWQWDKTQTSVVPPTGLSLQDALKDASPFWVSKVLGQFPTTQGENALIPMVWIKAAQERTLSPDDSIGTLGCDVGGGGDSSCIAHRRGDVVRIIREDRIPDTMQTCGNIIAALRETGATKARVDSVGIGRGVADRAKELDQPVIAVNVGEASSDKEQFLNLRAERYWALRDRFEQGTIDIDPLDEDLAAELASIRYQRTSKGQIKIESKDDAKRRGVPSPNRADAVVLAFAGTGGVTDTEGLIRSTPPPAYQIPQAPIPVGSMSDLSSLFRRR